MPILTLKNNTKRFIPYGKAAEINAILTGTKQPKDDDQAQFMATVASVTFDDLKQSKTVLPPANKEKRQAAINKVMGNTKLNGRQKAKKISEILKGEI